MSTVKIKLDHAALRALDKAAIRALKDTAGQLRSDIADAMVIPRDIGTLGDTAFFVDRTRAELGEVDLVNSTRYARRLYYHPEYSFHQEWWTDEDGKSHDGAPNAKAHWFEDWQEGGVHEKDAASYFAAFYKQEAGV